jgi:hypothetical protein
MASIVKTLDNKMLQDTQAGVIITSRRPHIVQTNDFIINRTQIVNTGISKRPKELEILLADKDVPDGVSDKAFGEAFSNLVAKGEIKAGTDTTIDEWTEISKEVLATLVKPKKEAAKSAAPAETAKA